MARFFCFILLLVVIALGSALWKQAGGSNPLIDLLAYAEARAQSVSLEPAAPTNNDASLSTAPAFVPAAAPTAGAWPSATPLESAPPAGQWPPGYHPPGEVGPPFNTQIAAAVAPAAAVTQPQIAPVTEPPTQAAGLLPLAPAYPTTPSARPAAIVGSLPFNNVSPSPPPNAYPETGAPQPVSLVPSSAAPLVPVPQQTPIATPQPPAPAPPQDFERTKVIGRVGSEVILAGDVVASVESMLADALKAGRISEEQIPAARESATRIQLDKLVARKLIFLDAKRTIPAANFPKVEEQMAQAWDKDVLKLMVNRMGVDNPAQLDAKLREAGTTLDREKRNFVEETLASQWLRSKINDEQEITHDSMLEYYQQHITEYQFFAKARWEHLMVRFDKTPSEPEAYARMAQMGNRLWSGMPWADVAKHESDGPTAPQGGLRDWTTQGSLVSTVIDRALFVLPVGALSPILRDEQGFHILRVVERTDAGVTPFSELQASIREKIKNDRAQKQRADFVEKLKRGVTIWTIYDGDAAADMVSLEPRPTRPARQQ